jgi:hypothetical protein
MAFCMNCGTQNTGSDRFCPNCGAPFQTTATTPAPATAPVPPPEPVPPAEPVPPPYTGPVRAPDGAAPIPAFSEADTTPAVQEYVRKTNQRSLVLSLVLYAAILLVMLGLQSFFRDAGLLDVPTAIGVAVVLILYALIRTLRKAARRNAAWEGIVENKRIRTKTDRGEHGPSHRHYFHEVDFQTSTGKRYKLDMTESAYNLYQPGEPVRKHRGFYVPERLYKTTEKTMCLACSRLNEPSLPVCANCKAPLLR